MNNFIILKTYNSRIEAELAKSKLNSENIDSFIEADDGGGVMPYLLKGSGFVKLKIKKEDFNKASKLLE